MSRRQRFLNPAHAGAVIALDSRFITGLSDGDPVSTWTDRSPNANNATQSGVARPIYKTGIRAGQPVVRFNGTTSTMSSALNPSVTMNGAFTLSATFIRRGNSTFPIVIGSGGTGAGTTRDIFLDSTSSYVISYGQFGSNVNGTNQATIDEPRIVVITRTSAAFVDILVNGTTSGSGTPSASNPVTSTQLRISGNALSNFLNGDILSAFVVSANISNPLRRRLEQATACSFKIPYG